jgi:hypothetical protein
MTVQLQCGQIPLLRLSKYRICLNSAFNFQGVEPAMHQFTRTTFRFVLKEVDPHCIYDKSNADEKSLSQVSEVCVESLQ